MEYYFLLIDDDFGVFNTLLFFLPGSPYTLEILDASQISAYGEGLKLTQINHQASFNITAQGAQVDNLKVTVTGTVHNNNVVKIATNLCQVFIEKMVLHDILCKFFLFRN